VTDHSDYDYQNIVAESQLVVDTRNATKGIKSPKESCAANQTATRSLFRNDTLAVPQSARPIRSQPYWYENFAFHQDGL